MSAGPMRCYLGYLHIRLLELSPAIVERTRGAGDLVTGQKKVHLEVHQPRPELHKSERFSSCSTGGSAVYCQPVGVGVGCSRL